MSETYGCYKYEQLEVRNFSIYEETVSFKFIPMKASQSVMFIIVFLANQLFQILNIKHFFARVISYI